MEKLFLFSLTLLTLTSGQFLRSTPFIEDDAFLPISNSFNQSQVSKNKTVPFHKCDSSEDYSVQIDQITPLVDNDPANGLFNYKVDLTVKQNSTKIDVIFIHIQDQQGNDMLNEGFPGSKGVHNEGDKLSFFVVFNFKAPFVTTTQLWVENKLDSERYGLIGCIFIDN